MDDGWVDAAGVDEVPEGRARVVCIAGQERVAVFRHEDSYSALSNVCAHQGGPLGEGRIVDGCVTCPWHGYQYLPGSGQSPPPYTERIATYEVRVRGERVEVRATALPPGTPVAPARRVCAAAMTARGARRAKDEE
jgi:nitrite reductase/ring-hydroxylating ferredoxin subunit